jgi:hypothetical protein
MEVATATEASAPAASGVAARQNHPFPWLDAAISEPYYFLHLIAFFSYFGARSAALSAGDDGGELYDRLLRRVSFRDPRPLDPDRVIWLLIRLFRLMRIVVGVLVFLQEIQAVLVFLVLFVVKVRWLMPAQISV